MAKKQTNVKFREVFPFEWRSGRNNRKTELMSSYNFGYEKGKGRNQGIHL